MNSRAWRAARALPLASSAMRLALPAAAQLGVGRSHVEGNVLAKAQFAAWLERDLRAWFRASGSGVSPVEYELLRQARTQSGVALPKYHVWVKALARGATIEQAAARVAAIDRERFEVTSFLSVARIRSASADVSLAFPPPLVPIILGRAGTK